uniref:RCC1-like domain-containing protein n=1 Tax=Hemiselmis tepida TaxID=464990 RepID=A0A7S0VEC2_9CRYP
MLGQAGVERCICGQLWVWGDNSHGQLGLGDIESRYTPTLVTSLSDLGIHIVDVALGAFHTVALSLKGNVYAWGYNANGQVGSWDTVSQAYPVRMRRSEPGKLFVSSIAAGSYHTVIVSDRGDVFTFGSNREGQLGIGYADRESHPVPFKINMPFLRGLRVVCGAYHCLAVTIDLTIYSWGWGAFGQLGLGGTSNTFLPTVLTLPADVPGFPVEFATGYGHSVMVLQTGDLTFCGVNIWGRNVCQTKVRFSPSVTNDEGGVWWVVSATRGQIIVDGNEALEFGAQGNIQLFKNETDLGVYPYTSVRNLEGYKFAFDSDVLAFPIDPFVADSIANTVLLV